MPIVGGSDGREFYEDRYRAGYMDDWPRSKKRRIERLIRDLPLPRRGRVLDLGCGIGAFTECLALALPNWEVYGADISTTALAVARERQPLCTFLEIPECQRVSGGFDLIFTHHVLEHVPNIADTTALMMELLAGGGSMMHVLPCGDPGSLIHYVASRREGGIDNLREGRFFFDESAHLRRLTTDSLRAQIECERLVLSKARYAEHIVGAFEEITRPYRDLRDVSGFADSRLTKGPLNRLSFGVLRVLLIASWCCRKPAHLVRGKIHGGINTVRDWSLTSLALPLVPLSFAFEVSLKFLGRAEWVVLGGFRGGSEMYLFFTDRFPRTSRESIDVDSKGI
jgi:SAM-dependent methyltransferase